ncbi:DUF488 domain-containing protein [Polyangium jinanense]|uniref:DUF488 domain-containing protein n=1 Tax=Polyangium jinanense TaxID=2829994 RepID=UPI0023404F1C|nr:DUF488 domain-containing protein [Polyangium jinanense]
MSAAPIPTIYTIGHGTRSLEELVETLGGASVARLFDVRRYPGSRRNPQFGRDALAASLPGLGVEYVFRGEELGGRRRPKRPSRHPALEDEGFRAYADYMDEPAFEDALEHLVGDAQQGGPLAVMCAETAWQRCHRRLIADALVLCGVPVEHLLSPTRREPHRLTHGVRADEHGRPVYDMGQTTELFSR